MIAILDNDPKKCAEMLDDKSLDRMIKDIAQVLCNAHYFLSEGDYKKNYTAPLPLSAPNNKFIWIWSQWARECVANYKYLTELGIECNYEYQERFNKLHNNNLVIHWAYDNVPDLPVHLYEKDSMGDTIIKTGVLGEKETPLPLVMPKKFISYKQLNHETRFNEIEGDENIIQSYRNYYQAKLKQKIDKILAKTSSIGKGSLCLCNIEWTRREKPEWIKI